MPSFEILGKLGLNTSDFDAGIKHAKKEADSFASTVAEAAGEAKEALKDVLKETGGGGIGKLLGLAGAAGAATAFGAEIVKPIKDGMAAYSKTQSNIFRLQTNLKDPTQAKEVDEFVKSRSGAGGSYDDLSSGMNKLLEANIPLEEAKKSLMDMQNIALRTGLSVETISAQFRKAEDGGLEFGETLTKLARKVPTLAPAIAQLTGKQAMGKKLTTADLEAALHIAGQGAGVLNYNPYTGSHFRTAGAGDMPRLNHSTGKFEGGG